MTLYRHKNLPKFGPILFPQCWKVQRLHDDFGSLRVALSFIQGQWRNAADFNQGLLPRYYTFNLRWFRLDKISNPGLLVTGKAPVLSTEQWLLRSPLLRAYHELSERLLLDEPPSALSHADLDAAEAARFAAVIAPAPGVPVDPDHWREVRALYVDVPMTEAEVRRHELTAP